MKSTLQGRPSKFDIIVIGGGPGGSTVATLVAMQGYRVLLLEREHFPRYQIGESLIPATVHGICAILGVSEEVAKAGFVRKNGAAFRWGSSSEPWIFGFSQSSLLDAIGANFAYQVERSKFDSILLDNARRKGVEVLEGRSVRDLILENGRIVGVVYLDGLGERQEARSTFVVDASGHEGLARRHVGGRIYSRFFQNIAMFGYFADGGRLPSPNEGNILCEAFSNGWLWYIPLRNEAPTLTSVGAVIGRDQIAKIQASPDQTMREFIGACPKIRNLLGGARRISEGQYGKIRIRKDWSYTSERFWIPGLVLIGDAACFVDPVLSSGVHLATYSALLAARSINTSLRNRGDEQRLFEEFERRYRLEYATFYNYLIAFYDMHRDEKSYYWEARKVLGTEEKANEAFVRLVAGAATAPDIYFQAKHGVGEVLQALASELQRDTSMAQRMLVTRQMAEQIHAFQISPGGVSQVHGGSEDIRFMSWGREDRESNSILKDSSCVPSADGFHWTLSN